MKKICCVWKKNAAYEKKLLRMKKIAAYEKKLLRMEISQLT